MTSGARPPAIFGPEPWIELGGQLWCHFDRWFALVAVAECEGDLEALRERLEQQHRGSLNGRADVEAKLSHLGDLVQRLSVAGLDAASLAGTVPADQATAAKSRRKVLTQALDGRAMTEPMRRTPTVLLHERARYGGWEAFPSDPRPWFDKLRGARPVAFASKGQTFDRARRLEERLTRMDGPRRTAAERLALYRAFHTLGLEVADSSDDSYGQIGERVWRPSGPTCPSIPPKRACRQRRTGRTCASCSSPSPTP